jgi:hypothetical protein
LCLLHCAACADVDELEGGYGHLQEGTTARLPLLMLDGALTSVSATLDAAVPFLGCAACQVLQIGM